MGFEWVPNLKGADQHQSFCPHKLVNSVRSAMPTKPSRMMFSPMNMFFGPHDGTRINARMAGEGAYMSVGELLEDSLDVCDSSPAESFTQIQFLFRAYLMPMTYLFGIFANSINVFVFTQKTMRNQPVNWFFLVLSLSDLVVLIASFFVFSVPVYAEVTDDVGMARTSAVLIVWFYPLAQTGLTMSVYLTILVSVHRFLGVCHPFLIQRVSNSSAVKVVIVFGVLFAFLFNTSRWFELQAMPCYSKRHDRESLVVYPTDLMVNSVYTVVYRNAAYTMVMFFLPFAILTFVNLRIIGTLRKSYQMRRMMMRHPRKKQEGTPIAVDTVTVSHSSTNAVSTAAVASNKTANVSNDRKENGVTVMLVAITTEFLLFNLLAFANNILELTGAYAHTQLETVLVEVSALLVNINGASTIVIYLIFGSKYRAIFIQLLRRFAVGSCRPWKKSTYPTHPQYETTQLLDSRYDDCLRRKMKGPRLTASEERPLKTKQSQT
ncbi:FMRFamide receptor [Trichostrongylus colubriformis]|uniref:FMRFamide receptor n=1 Tax=Trichostrongylus colubriformis TaxID=6319 RepID=A0AAN8ITP2_TRICO